MRERAGSEREDRYDCGGEATHRLVLLWVALRRLSKLFSCQYFPNIIGGILGSLNVRRADTVGVGENIPLVRLRPLAASSL